MHKCMYQASENEHLMLIENIAHSFFNTQKFFGKFTLSSLESWSIENICFTGFKSKGLIKQEMLVDWLKIMTLDHYTQEVNWLSKQITKEKSLVFKLFEQYKNQLLSPDFEFLDWFALENKPSFGGDLFSIEFDTLTYIKGFKISKEFIREFLWPNGTST